MNENSDFETIMDEVTDYLVKAREDGLLTVISRQAGIHRTWFTKFLAGERSKIRLETAMKVLAQKRHFALRYGLERDDRIEGL